MRRLAPAALLLVLFVPCASAWTWPVRGPVLQTFSFDQAHPYAAGQQRGIAIGADAGAPVLAPAAGLVSFAGTVAANGKTVTIQTAAGLAVSLTHLGSLEVSRGDAVAEGTVIGTAGSSGEPEFAVPYVHLGIRDVTNPQGYLDPLSFLPAGLVPVAEPAPTPAPVAEPVGAPVAAPPAAAPVVAEPAPAVAAPATSPTTHAAPAEAPARPDVQSAAPSTEAPAAQATAAQVGEAPAASAAAPVEPERSAPFEVRVRTAPASVRSPVTVSHAFSAPAVALRSPAAGPVAAGPGAARPARKAAASEIPASRQAAPSPEASSLRSTMAPLSARARKGDRPLRQPLLVAPLVVGGLAVGTALVAGLAFLLLRRHRRPLAPVVPLHSVPRPSERRRLAA